MILLYSWHNALDFHLALPTIIINQKQKLLNLNIILTTLFMASTKLSFFNLIQRIGSSGKYQDISLVFWSLCFMACGASTYFNAFLFYEENYSCPEGIESCKDYVCSLSRWERAKYINPETPTFLTKFGDFRCDSSIQIDGMLSFIYMGGLAGAFLGSFINQYISKRRLLILSVFMNMTGILITILGNSLFLASVGLFINYAAKSIQADVIPCIITETVEKEHRGKHIMVGYFFYGLGVTLNGAVFFAFKDWRMALIIYQILPFIVLLLGFVYFIEETPFDSIVYNSPEQSLEAFKRIASINQMHDHGLTLQQVRSFKNQYEENQAEKHNSLISVVDLFRYDSLRTIAIISIILQFLISYQFNVPELIIKDYALDIYWSGIILGSSQLLASLASYFLVNGYERKKLINIVQVLGILTSAPIFFFASCGESVEQCGVLSSVTQIFGIFMFRFFVTIGYNIFYMAQFEMFPTQIRSLAIQFTSAICVVAMAISPPIQSYFKEKGVSMIITFTASCVLIILGVIKMPETYNVPPPQFIEELKLDDETNMKETLVFDKIRST